MIFTIFIGVLFLAIVFFHYLQGFFSATISAILAVIAAVLAFSWHEAIVERLLQGKAANVAHAMVLVVLFAAIYTILRVIFDKAIPEGVTLPVVLDRVGGAAMGIVAAIFCTGTLAIAAQELPMGAALAGYTKYDAENTDVRLQAMGATQTQQGSNSDELKSKDAGVFKEEDRQTMFPIFPTGVDEIVVNTVSHLSSTGSMAGSQPLSAVHPDFLQELFGQRIGIQGGAIHVTLNLDSQANDPSIVIKGYYEIPANTKLRLLDGEYAGVRGAPVKTPLKLDAPFKLVYGKMGSQELSEQMQYASLANDKMAMLVVRITFGPNAADHDHIVRLSPGTIRLVTTQNGEPHNYYPIGTLEQATPHPNLFADKLDDFIFVPADATAGASRTGIDAVFVIDKAGALETAQGKKPRFTDDTFLEIKRMFREELGGKNIEPWTPAPSSLQIESLHQVKVHVSIGAETPEPPKGETPEHPSPTPTPTPAPAVVPKPVDPADGTTIAHLKAIHAAVIKDATDSGGFFCADLQSLVGPTLKPEMFLRGESHSAVPDEVNKQDRQHQASWVKEHTDFVYLGAGQNKTTVVPTFVLAYTNPGGKHLSFLKADGSVVTLDAAKGAKVIAELKAGKNPAPSLVAE